MSTMEEIPDKTRANDLIAENNSQQTDDVIEVYHNFKLKNPIISFCLSNDGKFIFTTCKGSSLVKWSIDEQKRIATLQFQNEKLLSISIAPNDKYLSVSVGCRIIILDPGSLKIIKLFKGHGNNITCSVFSSDSKYLYTSGLDKKVRIWNMDEMCFMESLLGHTAEVLDIDYIYNETIITSANDGCLRFWKIQHDIHLIFNASTVNVCCVKSLDERHFASGSEDGQLSLWSSHKKKPLFYIEKAHGYNPTTMEPYFIITMTSHNAKTLVTGSYDGYVNVWKIADSFKNIVVACRIEVRGFINALACNAVGHIFAAVGREHKYGQRTVLPDVTNGIVIINLSSAEVLNM